MPGTVLAVGILVPLVMVNNALQNLLQFDIWTVGARHSASEHDALRCCLPTWRAFWPSASILSKVACSVLRTVWMKLPSDSASTGVRLVRKVHMPLLRTSLISAAILVFVDVMKEMPITLITRPFGWDTLAVRVFNMTSIGEWERAALPAIAIVAVGLIPVAMLNRGSRLMWLELRERRTLVSARIEPSMVFRCNSIVDRSAACSGPSGCGKTTALRCIAGFEPVDRGWIRAHEPVTGAARVFACHRRIATSAWSFRTTRCFPI